MRENLERGEPDFRGRSHGRGKSDDDGKENDRCLSPLLSRSKTAVRGADISHLQPRGRPSVGPPHGSVRIPSFTTQHFEIMQQAGQGEGPSHKKASLASLLSSTK